MRSLGGFLSIGLVVVATTGGAVTSLVAAETSHQGWQSNFEEAQKTAQRLGKPLLIHFHATWCGPCQQMESSVLNTAAVTQQLGQRVVGIKINTDSRPDLSSKYGIGSLPSDLFVAPDGTVLSREGGAVSSDTYRWKIISVSNQYMATRLYQIAAGGSTQSELKTVRDDGTTSRAVGLDGFSPVSIVESKKWQKGEAQFAFDHAGVTYHMASAEELAKFKANPAKFTPGWLGHDPLELISTFDSVAGDIRFGAFYRQKLYLLSSEENRKNFLANPGAYEDTGKQK